MNRRHFLRNTSLAGFTIPSLVAATSANAQAVNGNDMEADAAFTVVEATIDDLQQRMKSNQLTSKALTQMYLKRIEEIDKSGPATNSVIEVNPDALSIAEALDKERKEGKVRGQLHGIPVLIKDNINSGDK